MIIEKIIRKRVFPKIQSNTIKIMLQMPVVSKKVKERICREVYAAFGGKAYEVIVGGAPLSQEVESFLKSIEFPITVGYGTTECAPDTAQRNAPLSFPIATITTLYQDRAEYPCLAWK